MTFLNEFKFDSFNIAMDVLKDLFKIRNKQGYVTYGQVYKYINNIEMPDIYNKKGWINLSDAKVEQINENGLEKGLLKLPKVIDLTEFIIFD